MIIKCLAGEPLPSMATAPERPRLALRRTDHVRALTRVFEAGAPGETYIIGGGRAEQTNIAVVQKICACLDRLRPRADGASYATQITYVADRPGHDHRYAIDPTKLQRELGWTATEELRERDREDHPLVPRQRGMVAADPERTYGGQRLGVAAG